jgi:WD40 repeat protein
MRQIWTAFVALAALALMLSGFARAAELSSEPMLRIEAGMHTAPIKKFSLSADGTLMVTGAADKAVRIWSLPDGRLLRTLRVTIDAADGGKVFAVALSPDGTIAAVGGWDAAFGVSAENYPFQCRDGRDPAPARPLADRGQ